MRRREREALSKIGSQAEDPECAANDGHWRQNLAAGQGGQGETLSARAAKWVWGGAILLASVELEIISKAGGMGC